MVNVQSTLYTERLTYVCNILVKLIEMSLSSIVFISGFTNLRVGSAH